MTRILALILVCGSTSSQPILVSRELGVPLHPSHFTLTPLLESFTSKLPQDCLAFALIPPYVIPPRNPRYPPALVHYVLSRVPPPPTPVPRNNAPGPGISPTPPILTSNSATSASTRSVKQENFPAAGAGITASLLAMPTLPVMNLTLDPKSFKWNWPGYLTFGRSPVGLRPSSSLQAPPAPAVESIVPTSDSGLKPDAAIVGKKKETLDVDTASLLEAISTESMGSYTRAASPTPSALSRSSQLGESSNRDVAGSISPVESGASPVQGNGDAVELALDSPHASLEPIVTTTSRATPTFLRSVVYLANPTESLATERRRVLHITVRYTLSSAPPLPLNIYQREECTVAVVVDMDHTLDVEQLADDAAGLIESLRKVMVEKNARYVSRFYTQFVHDLIVPTESMKR